MLKHTKFYTKQFFYSLIFLSSFFLNSQENIKFTEVSKDLPTNIKDSKSIENELKIVSESNLSDLMKQLKTDKEKIAFWVNIYNAFIQISLSENPKLYEDKGTYFSEKRIKIGGEILSFDDIEHGILRKSKVKIGLGYVRKWFRPKWERKLRVENVDWRIHFALNCGAKSCPPVAIYSPENLENELTFMTKAYLEEQTSYDKTSKTASTSVLMSWFRGDFGGKNGAKKILLDYKITPEKPKYLDFKTYDWTLLLGNFRTIPN
ncbi:hypothetical protein BTO13_09790 [Polaribacter gangjinensis]|uniref:DUF547 domain-containing protein n=1 Tax=Polaribacter gangjinensis TaxID=574710 RepID=A0A2S7WE10_9FLAO|nr:hypothetical protein BTO13_09790 [Polaribacter gangjinensis]